MSEAGSSAAVAALVKTYFNAHPADAAHDLERLDAGEIAGVLTARPVEDLVEVFRRFSPTAAADAIRHLEPARAGDFLRRLDPAQAAVLVSRLPDEDQTTLLGVLGEAEASEIRESMSYPPDSAGALMDPEAIAFAPETTAEQALDRLRGARKSGRHAVCLVDRDGKLMGSVPVLELAVADPGTRLDALADLAPPSLQAMAGRPEVLETFEKTKRAVLAVVDFHGRLLGVVRHAALLDAAREEVSADIQAMVGVSREETALSTVNFAVRKRLPWLQINLLTAFLAASVVGLFEATIAKFTALAVLLPVVAGQSGNTGAQALAVTMRGLALREIRPRHWARLATKEVSVAALNGVAVALTTSIGVYAWSRSTGLALVIGISMIISMAAAGLAGASIPVLLTALRQDPAQSSSIILTTVTDVVGFFSFLGIANLLASLI